ncbi:fumarylacetoacetate hydrolase domain-containing protein 2-like [Spodoptera frugiperda]|uniref:Fumarylacetoacetate hydrolase domain-containing protein 2-like n=1 Tax=Spodoptera frugiperda TaxID=7108 RepID=A0A9R0D6F6_SPOFR|nr:fumarylacetoacetate hydrolase domain-containing protein 2-like [Spodoptera frugiperda]
MKFVQFIPSDTPHQLRVGYLYGDAVVDVCSYDINMPKTMLDILKADLVHSIMTAPTPNPKTIVPLSEVTLKAPIHGMDKILCIALNYADHCKEQNLAQPTVPVVFNKFASTIIGPNEAVRIRTQVTKKVDWEAELVVVIGKTASGVKAADAFNYVFGYTIAQDISGRDWQKDENGGQFLLGKSQDTFCPIGPWIVTTDEISDPHNLAIKCFLNTELKQDSNTENLIYKIPALIERLSTIITLLPGDLILTGTPGGVGVYRDPPEFLKPGDVITSEIEKIGTLVVNVEQF